MTVELYMMSKFPW